MWVFAVRQRKSWSAGLLRNMHVVLLVLLQQFDVLDEELLLPLVAGQALVCLIRWPAEHQDFIAILWPGLLHHLSASFVPLCWITVDCPADVRVVFAGSAQHLLQHPLISLGNVAQWSMLVDALHKELEVHMRRACLLEFDRAIGCIDTAENPATCHGIAPEGVCARRGGLGTLRTILTEPHSKEMSQNKSYQRVEALA